jgi:hypothetical protein
LQLVVSPYQHRALRAAQARKVLVVPGYGLAVAGAQYAAAELCRDLGTMGIKVAFGIHPVAGRMPGQLNVLLAEAGAALSLLLDGILGLWMHGRGCADSCSGRQAEIRHLSLCGAHAVAAHHAVGSRWCTPARQ